MKKLFKILLVLAIVAGIGFVVKRQLGKGETADGALTLYGNVDIRQVALGFRASGRIDTMAFEEGDAVKAGQLLASLDKGPLQDSLALFEAQVTVAEASVAKLEAGSRPSEIAQAMVHGDRRPYLVGLIVPAADFVEAWAKENGKPGDLAALAEDAAFRQAVGAVVDRVNGRLSQLEKVRRFHIAQAPFTTDNAMMTPTLKVRRHKVREVYGEKLDALYASR